MSRRLGNPLMPWQQEVADVAFEYDPDTKTMLYREVVVTVPRQSGKTTLVLAVQTHRATRMGSRQNIVYTAQNRQKALKKFRDEHIPILDASIYKRRGLYEERKSNGSEALLWQNRSIWGIDAPTETSGHGDPLALATIDEAWARPDDRVEQAYAPAMIAQRNPQLWIPSTAGTEKSVYLYRKIVAGRANDGLPGPVAYFEWSAGEDDDPADPRTWRKCMPALGHTITEATMRAEWEKTRNRPDLLELFLRAYLNRWVKVPPIDEELPKLIPLDWFDACIDKRSKMVGRRVLIPEVSNDRTTAAIVAVAKSSRVGTHVEVIEHRPGEGTDWLMGRLEQLAERKPETLVAAHLGGPVGTFELDLKRKFDKRFKALTDAELKRGCGGVYTGIREGTFKHLGDPSLRAAVETAARSNRGDSWRFVRNTESPPLLAASVGWYVNDLPDEKPPPATANVQDQVRQAERELWRPSRRLDI